MSTHSLTRRNTLPLPIGTFIGLALAMLAVLASAAIAARSSRTREEAVRSVSHTREVQVEIEGLLSNFKDAETGQRGFLLTGEERYLDPFAQGQNEVPVRLRRLSGLVADNPVQLQRLDGITPLSEQKFAELAETIAFRRAGNAEASLAIVRSDRGKAVMDRIRTLLAEMRDTESALLEERNREWAEAVQVSNQFALGGSALLLTLIGIAGFVMSRDFRSRENLGWMRMGQAALATRMQGDQNLDGLGEHVASFVAGYLEAPVAAIFVNDSGQLRRIGGYGSAAGSDHLLRADDSLAGQVARDNVPLLVTDVPPGYLAVSSGLGRHDAAQLLIIPAAIGGTVQAVIELGFFRPVTASDREFLEQLREPIAAAIRGARDRTRLEELLEETQRQSEELQSQQEELRVNNEELEEQSRALKESQARLENQQSELEQINAHLEAQTQVLEAQRDELTRAQETLTQKATELERTNLYKSEFLANMSHELRTPLNSSLILATLLADNRDGNLTEEQIKFARTIYDAGNDLLALINDILDLSKIESGKVELAIAPINVAASVDAVVKTMAPLAEQKQLEFSAAIDADVPPQMASDAQRLGQVLKNLLSNAIKFTEQGAVTLRVSRDGNQVAFAVTDSGIGIPEAQHEVIFEAFRQADGSTHRKYGGTGLGLSIARDLARLLGGDITLRSEPGRGSQFVLRLPLSIPAGGVVATPPPAAPARSRPAAGRNVPAQPQIEDDRETLTTGSKRILVIEDDVAFASILRDLAREHGFQALVTHSANDGLAAAEKYAPSAILLDINLPDHSGLGVLDQLKRNPRTRHIPVHVASGADYSRQALERGAIGYALKPVRREQLVEAIHRLESKLSQGLKRVLVVEDDARQRESIRQLLAGANVEITGAATAAEARHHLSATTFDCVVMDLSLPDLSGYDLLERMAADDQVSFPPVIIYTGRTLTADEEQQLRRFSKSIIIKDARSPERLLDEVTLFLHQVESTLPAQQQQMLRAVRNRDDALAQRRILVVEDDARNIFALTRVLEPRGATVAIARNGQEALDALARVTSGQEPAIDLVLMDIMMPVMDGITAMQEIRKRPQWQQLPIIALTAKAMADDQDRCLKAGANDYMAKPFDVDKLLSLVRVWMPK